jgi:hypothetical protein
MRKGIRVLEVPLLLLIMALEAFDQGSTALAIILLVISIGRLALNVITDEFIYKK